MIFALCPAGLGGGGLMILSQAVIADVILPATVAATGVLSVAFWRSRRWLVR